MTWGVTTRATLATGHQMPAGEQQRWGRRRWGQWRLRKWRWGLAVAGWLVGWLVLAGGPLAAQPSEVAFVEGLRQRRLYDLAAAHCQERLARLALGAPERADWTVELIRTLAEHAAAAPPSQRAALWKQAHQAAADFLQQVPTHPRAVLVRVQQALTFLAEGETGQKMWEASLASPEEREAARQVLRQASNLLEEIAERLRQEIPLRHRSPPPAGGLSVAALENLALQVQQQLARAQRRRALLFEAESDDRLALLAAAAASLQALRSRLADNHPLCSSVELDLAETFRLLSQPAQAAPYAQRWDDPAQPPAIRWRARAERMRLALAQRQWDQLAALVDLEEPPGAPGWCELALARLEGLLALQASGSQPGSGAPAQNWQAQAAALAQTIATHCGGLTAQRASRLVAATSPAPASQPRQLLVAAAEGLRREGKLDQAASAYERAAAAAQAQGDPNAAFEWATQAALLLQQQGDHRAAADRLRALATSQPQHPQAATAHLAAAWNAAQAARQNPEELPRYESILREHLDLWPEGDLADQARLWLARLHLGRQQPDQAITTAKAVSPASIHYSAAMQLLADAWKQKLATAQHQLPSDQVHQALAFFRQALQGQHGRLPERWTAADQVAALMLAELILRFQPANAAEAETTLRTALERSADNMPPQWHAAAQALWGVALAAQPGRAQEASQVLLPLQQTASEALLESLLLLDGLTKVTPAERQSDLAGVMLEVSKALLELELQLPEASRPVLKRIHAEALASAGHRQEALAILERLASNYPDDGQIQESFAKVLLASDEPADWSKALRQWRWVATRSPPRSDRWFAAKYGVALAHYKLGQRGEAAALLAYLLNVPPGMQGSVWEAAYRELLAQCQTPQGVAPVGQTPDRRANPGPAASKGSRGR
jgi:hypothetical protein